MAHGSKKLTQKLFGEYLEKGERIEYVMRTHPIIMHTELAKIKFLYIALPLAMWYFIPASKYLAIALLLVGAWKVFETFINWYYDTWLITNMGVISIGGKRFWGITTTRIEYHMIEGITYQINGFWQSMLEYGRITLEKVGGGQTVVSLDDAYRPREAESAILKCQKAYMRNRNQEDNNELKKLLTQLVANHASA